MSLFLIDNNTILSQTLHVFSDLDSYNNDTGEDTDKKCSKLRARLLNIETSSTCTVEQAHSPAAMTVIREADPKEEEEDEGGNGHEGSEVRERSTRVKRARGEDSYSERERWEAKRS